MKALDEFLNMLRQGDFGALTPGMIDDLDRAYPFFTLPAAALLIRDNREHFLSVDERKKLLGRLALNAVDSATLMALIEPDGSDMASFYPVEKPVERTTDDAIDTFLATYGRADSREEEVLNQLIFNPQPDYASVLEAATEGTPSEAEPQDATASAIDSFLKAMAPTEEETQPEPEKANEPAIPEPTPAPAPAAVEPAAAKPRRNRKETAAQAPEGGSLTESLALMYIRRGRYEKAYELLSNVLHAKDDASPFIDVQLRFLRKAIIARGGTPG